MFCGATEALTREHVIPLWLQRHVGGSEVGGFRGTHLSFFGSPISERAASGNSHTLGTVCASCNNGWMSRLESDFQTLLPRLQFNPSPRQFSKTERRTIATWIVKTGVVAHRSSNYREILPPSVAQALRRGTSIPAGVKVFGGKVDGGKSINWAQSNLALCRLRQADYATFDAYRQTFVFALAIERIFIGFGWHDLNPSEFEIFHLGSATHHIYPHPETAKERRIFEDLTIAAKQIGLRYSG